MSPATTSPSWSPIDRVYAGLRLAALLVGLAYPYLAHVSVGVRHDVVAAFGVFALYGLVLYAIGFRWLRSAERKARFYAMVAVADLVFVLVLMNLTGGAASPFYRALYLWVAMPALYFGLRTGTVTSAIALVVFGWLFDFNKTDLWDVLVRAGGLMLHGPMIGYLIDRDRAQQRRVQELQARVDTLDHTAAWQVARPGPIEPDTAAPSR
jgi:hypothetical protein